MANLTGKTIPADGARELMLDALTASSNATAEVTSTTRSSQDQAQEMLTIIRRDGVEDAKKLYGAVGDDVIDTYVAYVADNPSAQDSQILGTMAQRVDHWVTTLGVNRTQLMHVAPSAHITFDVAPSSLSNINGLINYLSGHPEIARIIKPGEAETALHVEVLMSVNPIAGLWSGSCTLIDEGESETKPMAMNLSRGDNGYYGTMAPPGEAAVPLGGLTIDRRTKTVLFNVDGTPFSGNLDRDNKKFTFSANIDGASLSCGLGK